MVSLGLLTAFLPFALNQQPAGATVTEDRESKTIDFAGVSTFVTCTAYLDVVHDTDDSGNPTFSATATADPGCDADIKLAATFTDKNGVSRSSSSAGFRYDDISVDGAVKNVKVSATFVYTDCLSGSAQCTATVTAAPK
jgi:hypothetical protein